MCNVKVIAGFKKIAILIVSSRVFKLQFYFLHTYRQFIVLHSDKMFSSIYT